MVSKQGIAHLVPDILAILFSIVALAGSVYCASLVNQNSLLQHMGISVYLGPTYFLETFFVYAAVSLPCLVLFVRCLARLKRNGLQEHAVHFREPVPPTGFTPLARNRQET